jgi:hypothetical protein
MIEFQSLSVLSRDLVAPVMVGDADAGAPDSG